MSNIDEFLNELLPKNNKVIINFFILFSRFEYALKEANFLKEDKRAKPNWVQFVKYIESNFNRDSSIELEKSVDYLLNHPPKIQYSSEPKWKKSSSKPTEVGQLLYIINNVRNNLFHGGKYSSISLAESTRDTDLLNHSSIVLRYLLDIDQSIDGLVSQKFFEK